MAAHQDIRQGSSVRGAIDLTLVAGQLFNLTAERLAAPQGPATETPASAEAAERAYRELVYDAMVVALSGRLGRGRLRRLRTYRDVPPALSDIFAS
jgi:MoxR-like ATPase